MNRDFFASAVLAVVMAVSNGALCWGAVLTDEDLTAGKAPAVGDTVLLTDFAQCFPRSAIGQDSVKGKWRLRPYRTETASEAMLCVEERDQENPQACMAPALTYPLDIDGVYEIWVGTYRPLLYGGGIDIRLTRDKTYFTVNPCEDGVDQWPPPEDNVGRLVECYWTTADVSGQDLHLRQPYGTFDSLWWGLCEAHVAYIKFVRRSPEELEGEAADRAKLERKGVIIDRDGFSWVWQYGREDVDCIVQQVESLRFGNVDALNWCIGGSLSTNFPHPMTDGRIRGGNRLGDKRAERVFQWFEANGHDILDVLVNRCHEAGIKIYASHRANVHYRSSNVWDEHPEWHLESRRGLDYANPEARGFYRDFLLYIAENYDIDGLTIDFSRHRRHFNPGQEDQFAHMNAYMRDLRSGLDRISEERGMRLELNASFTTGTWYDNWTAEQQGLDVHTWVDENLVDRIMPEGREVMRYIEMCIGKKTQCYARKTASLDFNGASLQPNLHDPTPKDDTRDQPMLFQYGPHKVLAGVLNWYDAGADGVFLFNQLAHTPLRNLPYPDLIRDEVANGTSYGRRLGERVTWLDEVPGDDG